MELFVSTAFIAQTYRRWCWQSNHCSSAVNVVANNDSLRNIAGSIVQRVKYAVPAYCALEYHGQLQTLTQFILRNVLRVCSSIIQLGSIDYTRELLTMPDGGTIALDWAARRGWVDTATSLDTSTPVVVLHHGLVGDSQAEYIYHLAGHLLDRGYRVVVFVARGCGGLKLTSPELFAGRRVSDCAYCIQHIKERYPAAKLFWISFSLGAALGLQYLAEDHESILRRTYAGHPHPSDHGPEPPLAGSTPLTAAMCVCPPWDISNNKASVAALWMMLLATPMKLHCFTHLAYLHKHAPNTFQEVTLWRLLACRNMNQIDTLLYPTHHKASGGRYPTLRDYYDDISPVHGAHRITTPTLVLTAEDDPVCVHSNAPSDPNKMGPGLVVVKTPFGGHLAYPQSTLPSTVSWADRVAIEWIESFLQQ